MKRSNLPGKLICSAYNLYNFKDGATNTNVSESIIWQTDDIVTEILSHSNSDFVALACVSKKFEKLTKQWAEKHPPEGCIGKAEWLKYGADEKDLGEKVAFFPIPLKLYQDCAKGSFLCTFIPETLNGVPLTLSSIDQFVSNRKNVVKSNYKFPLANYGITDETAGKVKAHWAILSRDVLEGTRNKPFDIQKGLVEEKGFEIPNLIDAVVSLLMHHLHTDEFIYPDGSEGRKWTFTRVQEVNNGGHRIAVGGFSASGLDVHKHFYAFVHGIIGASCARKSIGT